MRCGLRDEVARERCPRLDPNFPEQPVARRIDHRRLERPYQRHIPSPWRQGRPVDHRVELWTETRHRRRDDGAFVCGLDGPGDLAADLQRLAHRKRPAREPLRQGLALDQLEHQVGRAGGVLEPKDPGDVRMVERGQEPRLALEARQPFGILCEGLGEPFDRHLAPETRVARPVDLAHPARAERRGDLVGAEAGTCSERHPDNLPQDASWTPGQTIPGSPRIAKCPNLPPPAVSRTSHLDRSVPCAREGYCGSSPSSSRSPPWSLSCGGPAFRPGAPNPLTSTPWPPPWPRPA